MYFFCLYLCIIFFCFWQFPLTPTECEVFQVGDEVNILDPYDGDIVGTRMIQVDIGGYPPFSTGSKQFSGKFGNLLFLTIFNFQGHFEGPNEGFLRSRFLMTAKGIIDPPKWISSMIPSQRAIMHLKRRSYAKFTTTRS